MRLIYTADLHGEITSYTALLDMAVASEAQAVVVGGDLLPHAMRLGSAVEIQRAFVERELRPLLAAFRAAHDAIGVYLLPGNDDWAAAVAALDAFEQDGLAFPLHNRAYAIQPAAMTRTTDTHAAGKTTLWLAGYACVPPTPFSIKDYERRDDAPLPGYSFDLAYSSLSGTIQHITTEQFAAQPSLADELAALAQQSDPARTIYVCHSPPADTPLDRMWNGRHVGSHALRSFIERHAPPLTLHGHIHEAPQLTGHYATQIGSTWCINPGHDQRRLHAVLFDTDDVAGTLEHTVFGRPKAEV